MVEFREIHVDETRHPPDYHLAMHRHHQGYLALVLDGGYEEASVDGRYVCAASTLVWHPAFHLHENRFRTQGATVLNLPAPMTATPPPTTYCVAPHAPVKEIAALAEKDINAAAIIAFDALMAAQPQAHFPDSAAPQWLHAIAHALRRDSKIGASSLISALAKKHGVSPEHAARQFKKHFAVSPSAYRREHRVRHAMNLIQRGLQPASVAYRCGYADQSHLVKEFRKVTGATPGTFRPA